MKRILLLLIMCLLITYTHAKADSPFSMHEDNYLTAGQDDAKAKISAEFNLLYPFNSGLLFAYTEEAYWNIYNKSAPFNEYIHNPEVFWRVESGNNLFYNSSLGIFDYITAGFYEHKSNGRDGPDSRGIDMYYGEAQASYGSKINSGIRLKGFGYYKVAKKNHDIADYLGNSEGELFIKYLNDAGDTTLYKLYVKGGGNFETRKGWVEAGAVGTIVTAYIQPKFFLNVYHGYMDGMVEYNKIDTQVRFGLIFMDD